MRVAENLEMLDVHLQVMGVQRVIHPTLMWDDENVVLIDTGVPGTLEAIRQQAEAAGVPFARLNHIVFTQQDIDHISGAADLLAGNPGVTVYAHEKDAPHIRGEKRLSRLTDAFMERISDRPEEEQAAILRMFDDAVTPVDRVLHDGDHLPFCGGVTVIHTPGHTAGHICLYHHASKTLIAGDALNILHGELVGPNEDPMAEDGVVADDAVSALQKLAEYDLAAIITYHGGLFDTEPNKNLDEVIAHRKLYSYRR
jgi:glyoxylase-like metal-dependent hydrolase (beta-lactamase superfamily II)